MATTGETQMDMHAMQSEVRYFFSGYGRRGEEEIERKKGVEKGETEAASLRGKGKRERTQAEC